MIQSTGDWLLDLDEEFWKEVSIEKNVFKHLLTVPLADRADVADQALALIASVLERHSKNEFVHELSELAVLERTLAENPCNGHRDHVLHSLFTYVIGWALYRKWLQLGILGDNSITILQWTLAALLHDAGYLRSIEGNPDLFLKVVGDTSNIVSWNDMRTTVITNCADLQNLGRFGNGIDLIITQLASWDLSHIKLRRIWADELAKPQSHGLWSAMSIMYLSSKLYDKADWRSRGFEDKVVPASSAILLHDLRLSDFGTRRISFHHAPLAWLLRVSDALQDWNRPSGKIQNGFDIGGYKLEICSRKVRWIMTDHERAQSIRRDVKPLCSHYLLDIVG